MSQLSGHRESMQHHVGVIRNVGVEGNLPREPKYTSSPPAPLGARSPRIASPNPSPSRGRRRWHRTRRRRSMQRRSPIRQLGPRRDCRFRGAQPHRRLRLLVQPPAVNTQHRIRTESRTGRHSRNGEQPSIQLAPASCHVQVRPTSPRFSERQVSCRHPDANGASRVYEPARM